MSDLIPDPLTAEVSPDSRMARRSKGVRGLVQSAKGMQEPVFCFSCGQGPFGWVPVENMTFVSYLCRTCEPKYAAQAGMLVIPDEVFWARVKAEQVEHYGRERTAEEVAVALTDPDSLESQLARARADLTPPG